jgi:hypothetical protein
VTVTRVRRLRRHGGADDVTVGGWFELSEPCEEVPAEKTWPVLAGGGVDAIDTHEFRFVPDCGRLCCLAGTIGGPVDTGRGQGGTARCTSD